MIFPLERLADIVWPRMCQICGREVDRPARHICSDCLMRLPFLPADGLCRKCGRDAPGLDGEFLCDECRAFRPSFDRAVSSFRMEGDARELVNAFKFRDAIYLRDDLVDFLEASVRVRFVVDGISCVVPIPSTLSSRFLRGYSQCEILAKALARRLGKPFARLLRRVGAPRSQRGLSEEDRRKNVVGTFTIVGRRAVPELPLVIDDVMTTGSTLSEAAKTLKSAGAAKVYCASVARAVR